MPEGDRGGVSHARLWDALDALVLSCETLQFLMRLRKATGVGLKEAQDALDRRYQLLRESRPNEFTETHEEYWEGFYS